MHRPRVLVVDDSVVVRRLVSKALEAEGEVEVVGVAADGKIALVNIERLHPDVVILDVAMPVMDGLTALAEIRQRWPGLPVIMFSTLTTRGAEVTLDALALGASDYVLKPSGGDAASSMEKIRAELLPRIAALLPAAREAKERAPARIPQRPSRATGTVARATGPAQRVDLIAIGVSTGGPTALAELIPSLPATLPVPVVIVQHMPPMFTKILAERLDHKSAVRVLEAADGDRVKPGSVYIAPGDLHLAIAARDREVLHVYDGPHENSCRPSVDPLFRTVAERYGAARARHRHDRDGLRRSARGGAPGRRRRADHRAGRRLPASCGACPGSSRAPVWPTSRCRWRACEPRSCGGWRSAAIRRSPWGPPREPARRDAAGRRLLLPEPPHARARRHRARARQGVPRAVPAGPGGPRDGGRVGRRAGRDPPPRGGVLRAARPGGRRAHHERDHLLPRLQPVRIDALRRAARAARAQAAHAAPSPSGRRDAPRARSPTASRWRSASTSPSCSRGS